ncbi:hypothetical protein Tco_0168391 [Tanacetum coccineum]
MGPFGGAHLQHSRDAPGRGLARPSLPQPSSSQTHDPPIIIFCFHLLYIYYSCRDVSNFETGPRERNIDEYWWRIYKSGDLEVLES